MGLRRRGSHLYGRSRRSRYLFIGNVRMGCAALTGPGVDAWCVNLFDICTFYDNVNLAYLGSDIGAEMGNFLLDGLEWEYTSIWGLN